MPNLVQMPEGQVWKRHVDHIRELGEKRVRSPTPNLTSGSAEDGPVANPQPVSTLTEF